MLWEGREHTLRPTSRWRERYALAAGGREVARLDGKGWGKRPVRITVADAEPVEHGLLLLAAYVVRGLAGDAAGVGASAASTTG